MLSELRHSARTLRKAPGFTAIALVTITAGIAATATMFSVVRGVLLRPLPYRDPGRLVTILDRGTDPVAPADFLDWKRQSTSFESMAAASAWSATMSGSEQAVQVTGLQMSEDMFDMLGVPPLLGRTPAREEYEPGKERVAVLGYALWQRQFGGDRGVLGRDVRMNGAPYTVVGVMPPEFRFAPFWVTEAEVWSPLTLADKAANRGAQFMRVFARLKPGVSIAQAQAEIGGIAKQLAEAYPDSNAGRSVRVDPLHEKVVGKVRPALIVLAAAVGFVLLIACANTASLALARAVTRRREIAIRVALGASRLSIVRKLLAESVLLSLAAGLAGTAIAFWSMEAIRSFLAQGADRFSSPVPRSGEIAMDAWALGFSVLVSLFTGILFGLAPAIEAVRSGVGDTLTEAGRSGGESGRTAGLRSALVVAQIAMSVILLAGAGLLLRSFLQLRSFHPGFEPSGVLTMAISVPPQPRYAGAGRDAFYAQALDSLHGLPGVQSAGMVNHLPVGGDVWGSRVYAEAQAVPRPGDEIRAVYRVCRPGYFPTMRIRLASGRDFTPYDDENAPKVAVVNETLANRLWPGGEAIGKRFTRQDPRQNPTWLTVVGVIRDVAQRWSEPPDAEFYIPFRQDPGAFSETSPQRSSMTLVVRTAGDPLHLANAVRGAFRTLDRDVAVSSVRSLDQVIAHSLWQSRLQLVLLAAFAAFAVALAAVGIYGVIAYSVNRRTREIGIRMALGARQSSVLWMVLGQGFRLTLAGLALGFAGAFVLTRGLARLLYGVGAADPATFASVGLVLALVALLACYLPARAASAIDPAVALRRD